MKKILVILLTLVISASIFAEDKNPFSFKGEVTAYSATAQDVTKDLAHSYAGLRFRPYFLYNTDNVQAVLKLEVDQVFGDGSTDNKSAKVGNDVAGIIEVKAAYVKYMIPAAAGLSIKGGVDEYKTPGGLFLGTEVPMFMLNYNFDKHNIGLVYIKVTEGNEAGSGNGQDDAALSGLDFDLKFGAIGVRPALYVYQIGKASSLATDLRDDLGFTVNEKEITAVMPSIGFSYNENGIGINFAFAYGTASAKMDATNIDLTGMAASLDINYEVQKDLTVGGFFEYLSGDDDSTANKIESFSAFQLKSDGYGRMFLIENKMTFDNLKNNAATTTAKVGKPEGLMLVGLTAKMKFSPVTLMIQGAYGQLAKVASGAEKDLGFEIDASIAYEIEKNSNIIAEFAFLAPGKGYGDSSTTQNAMYAALGMKTKF